MIRFSLKIHLLLESVLTALQVLRSPTRYTLGSMVSHFQKLFDVTSLSGVYPRMNEVYTKLGEMTTVMKNLRDVLELGDLQLDFFHVVACFNSFKYLCYGKEITVD